MEINEELEFLHPLKLFGRMIVDMTFQFFIDDYSSVCIRTSHLLGVAFVSTLVLFALWLYARMGQDGIVWHNAMSMLLGL